MLPLEVQEAWYKDWPSVIWNALFGLGWGLFCFSDKQKEGFVSDACRDVSAVMLSLVGGILLLW